MAGLTAARTLAEAGRPIILLEASSRVGGRIHTIRDGDEIIELGAEFIHGKPPELWDLIEEAGLETYELDGAMLSYESAAEVAGLADRPARAIHVTVPRPRHQPVLTELDGLLVIAGHEVILAG